MESNLLLLLSIKRFRSAAVVFALEGPAEKLKDTTAFINFIEKPKIPEEAFLPLFLYCIVSYLALYSHNLYYSCNTCNPVLWRARNYAGWLIPFKLISSIERTRLASKSALLRRGLLAWSKHAYICLAAPNFEPAFDITVCMDVVKNPGPDNETTKPLQAPKPLLPTVSRHLCREPVYGTQDQLYSSCVVLLKPHSELPFLANSKMLDYYATEAKGVG